MGRLEKELRAKKAIVFLLILISGLAVFIGLLNPEKANSLGPYLNSTHGNSVYGVNRTDLSTFGYPRGHCAHCHEQHASIGGLEPAPTGGPDKYLLFSPNYTSQTDNVCLKCHTDLDSYQTGGLVNRSYSYRAGRYTSDLLNDIREAFNYCSSSGCGSPSSSSHNLDNIKEFITGKWNYTADSNPCNACHNPHMAIGDPANAPNSGKTLPRGYSPVSLPSLHSKVTSDWGLWGDYYVGPGLGNGERMNNYTSGYQAPCNNGTSTTCTGYEPDGSSTQNGSNLTDFVSFCTDCHNATNNIPTSHGSLPNRVTPGYINKFNWANDHHGRHANTNYCGIGGPPPTVSLLAAPYNGLTNCGQYVLSCTDCHEPHGSPNNFLVRPWVNNGFNDCPSGVCAAGTGPLSVTVTNYGTGNGPDGRENKEWVYLCGKCHTNLNTGDAHTHPIVDYQNDGSINDDCLWCHPNGGDYRNCGECHYHGSKYTSILGVDRPLF